MELFRNERECCACGACVDICPKNAIRLEENINGFLYPIVDERKCINCGLCYSVCDMKKKNKREKCTSECYFATRKNTQLVMQSTSGGIFAVLAEYIISQNGIVYGCTMEKKDKFRVYHKGIADIKDLNALKGSKYVQSNTTGIFKQVLEELKKNTMILFCGTPCQVAGLNRFLKKDYKNLFTVDLICHGVPSERMFNDFVKNYEKNNSEEIQGIDFRSKKEGIDSTRFFYAEIKSEKRVKRVFCKLLSYYGYFLDGDIYRESCYFCKYACPERIGDITLGDGWGAESALETIKQKFGKRFNKERGISTVLINSEKGKKLFDIVSDNLLSIKTDIKTVSMHNHQLSRPSQKKKEYEDLMEQYHKWGYEYIDQNYFSKLGKKQYLYYKLYIALSNRISNNFKEKIKVLLNHKI